jgi:hypothetical protein
MHDGNNKRRLRRKRDQLPVQTHILVALHHQRPQTPMQIPHPIRDLAATLHLLRHRVKQAHLKPSRRRHQIQGMLALPNHSQLFEVCVEFVKEC